MQGVVKWFDVTRGYGFITGDDGTEYFAHFSSIDGVAYRTLAEGQRLVFDAEGIDAVNIRLAKE